MIGPRLGVDIGGTRCKIGRVEAGQVVARTAIELTPQHHSAESLAEAIAGALVPLAADISELGVGVAAVVDSAAGDVVSSPNLPWLNDRPLAGLLAAATGLHVRLDNDVNCVGWGEARAGAGRGCDELLCLALGTGLGGAIIRNGELHRGQHGRAAELGHVPFRANGPPCGCGGRGCVEQYASKIGLLRLAADMGWHPEPGDAIVALFRAAAGGDRRAIAVVDEAAGALGFLLGWTATLLAPSRIVISGGIAAAWPQLRVVALSSMREQLRGTFAEPVVVSGELAEDAGTIGAALLFSR